MQGLGAMRLVFDVRQVQARPSSIKLSSNRARKGKTMYNVYSQRIAAVCFTLFFIIISHAVVYKIGEASVKIPAVQPVYRSGELPYERDVLGVYVRDGVIEAVSMTRLSDGRIFRHNIYGGPVLYETLEVPLGWMEIPEGLYEVLK